MFLSNKIYSLKLSILLYGYIKENRNIIQSFHINFKNGVINIIFSNSLSLKKFC